MLSADWSLTDKTTWITLLTALAAVASDVFHADLAPYVAPAATLAAGIVTAGVAVAKHHYSAQVVKLAAAVPPSPCARAAQRPQNPPAPLQPAPGAPSAPTAPPAAPPVPPAAPPVPPAAPPSAPPAG